MPSPRNALALALLAILATGAGLSALAIDLLASPSPASDSFHSSPRMAHLRLWDANGTLLSSTWPDEPGLFDPHAGAGRGPVRWNASDTSPVWRPLMSMLNHAPSNVTITIDDYTIPNAALQTLWIPRAFDLAREGTLGPEAAQRILGNVTGGERVRFVGQIPLDVLAATSGGAAYRFAIDGDSIFNVTHAEALQIEAKPLGDRIAFLLHAPTGQFTVHNNCQLPSQAIAPGHYVVAEESEDAWTLTRYGNYAEFLLQGQKVKIEARFTPDSNSEASEHAPHEHSHEESP